MLGRKHEGEEEESGLEADDDAACGPVKEVAGVSAKEACQRSDGDRCQNEPREAVT